MARVGIVLRDIWRVSAGFGACQVKRRLRARISRAPAVRPFGDVPHFIPFITPNQNSIS